ncbi:MAG: DUF2213 domain-containing protein [Janthinobacterium lividum]
MVQSELSIRHPDDIFAEKSLHTLKQIPVTLEHPPVFVNHENAHMYQVGLTGEHYRIDEDKIIVSVTVTHADAIEAILSGKQELSLGYNVTLVKEDGIYNGEPYQYRQLSPDHNHVAIVERGRAGKEVRFRFDGVIDESVEILESINEEQRVDDIDTKLKQKVDESVVEITINKESKIMSEDKLQQRIDTLIEEKEYLKKNNDKDIELFELKLKQTQSKLDSIEKAYNQAKKDLEQEKSIKADDIIAKRVDNKIELLVTSAPYLKNLDAYLHHTDREVMETVINIKNREDRDFSNEDDSYIKGKFDEIVGAGNKDRRDYAEVFNVLKAHNDHTSCHSKSDQMFDLVQDIKQKRMTGK